MIILLLLILAAPLEATTIVTDTPGEMGPAMLMVQENNTAPQSYYTQSLQLHKGWNLVSWHVVPYDPTPLTDLFMVDILPNTTANDWFFDHGGKLYTHQHAEDYYNYPELNGSGDWVWHSDYAFYIKLDNVSAEDGATWGFADRPRFTLGTIHIEPSPAWDDSLSDPFYPDQATNGWFFMGYAAPGYCKLATIYTQWPPLNGSQQCRTYMGPFHKLYWNVGNNYQHFQGNQQYLVMVRSDDGKIYLPYDIPANNRYYPSNTHGQEYDEIGVLEPGRGYFLAFRKSTAAMEFAGWGGYPGWPTQGLPPNPGGAGAQTCAAPHFQFNAYTQWCYPVFIDTVDLAATPMVSGDEIGVFDGDLCVGASVYSGEFPLKITCWKDDIATLDTLDGYQAGYEMTFVWYDASANAEVTFVPPPGTQAMVADDPIAPTHSGFGAGMYGVRSMFYGVQSVQQLPLEYKLGQNFPNPFNAETVIPLELPQRSHVKIELFNVRGQNLGVVYEGIRNAGWEKVRYNASRLTSGIYFLRVTCAGLERQGKFVDVGKMLILK